MATITHVRGSDAKEPAELSAAEMESVQARIRASESFLKALKDLEVKRGKYKIEILFPSSRNLTGVTAGIMTFWESGTKFHGGGDSTLHICAGKRLGINDCEAFIGEVDDGVGHLVCPKCMHAWKGDEVTGQIILKLNMSKWAEVVLRYFARLDHNADIYVKHAKDDIRAAALADPRKFGGEKLAATRQHRVQYIYPLANIIKDCAGGADLYNRFRAFLTA